MHDHAGKTLLRSHLGWPLIALLLVAGSLRAAPNERAGDPRIALRVATAIQPPATESGDDQTTSPRPVDQVSDPPSEAGGRSPSDLPPPADPQVNASDELPPPTVPPPPSDLLASQSALGITLGGYSAAPNMIGDHFGGLLLLQTPGFSGFAGATATVALAGGDRRFKISENVSPIPRDRLFFNYNHFENALTDISGVTRSLDRFTLGLEKTFFDGEASIETRLPLLCGLNSRQTEFGPDNGGDELGNLAMAAKMVLYSTKHGLISGGLAMTFPTGDDFVSIPSFGGPAVRVENQAVHLGPFLGYLVQPNECWFAQGFVQADFDLSGNNVYTGGTALHDHDERRGSGAVDHQSVQSHGHSQCHRRTRVSISRRHVSGRCRRTAA